MVPVELTSQFYSPTQYILVRGAHWLLHAEYLPAAVCRSRRALQGRWPSIRPSHA